MYDPMRGWSSKRGLLEGSVARNSAHLESPRARNSWSISHKNMGRKLRFSTLEFCLLHHWYPRRPMGSPDAALADVWKRTGWTSNNALGKQIWTVVPNQALVWLEGCVCKRGAMDDRGGRLCKVLYEVAVSFLYTCFRIGSRPKEGCVFRMRTSDLRPQTSWSVAQTFDAMKQLQILRF